MSFGHPENRYMKQDRVYRAMSSVKSPRYHATDVPNEEEPFRVSAIDLLGGFNGLHTDVHLLLLALQGYFVVYGQFRAVAERAIDFLEGCHGKKGGRRPGKTRGHRRVGLG